MDFSPFFFFFFFPSMYVSKWLFFLLSCSLTLLCSKAPVTTAVLSQCMGQKDAREKEGGSHFFPAGQKQTVSK